METKRSAAERELARAAAARRQARRWYRAADTVLELAEHLARGVGRSTEARDAARRILAGSAALREALHPHPHPHPSHISDQAPVQMGEWNRDVAAPEWDADVVGWDVGAEAAARPARKAQAERPAAEVLAELSALGAR